MGRKAILTIEEGEGTSITVTLNFDPTVKGDDTSPYIYAACEALRAVTGCADDKEQPAESEI